MQSLIDCDPIRSPALETIYEERPWIEVVPCLLTFFEWHCHLYILWLPRQLFLAADSQKLFSSPQRAHVIFFVKRQKFVLALWLLCSVHAVIQVPPDGVVGSRNCHCHSFAACTVDMTVCFGCQTVSALTSGLWRYSAQPTPWPCWLHLDYFGQNSGCWLISCHHHWILLAFITWNSSLEPLPEGLFAQIRVDLS